MLAPLPNGPRRGWGALKKQDLETNKACGWQQGTEIAVDQFVEHVMAMK